MSSQQGLINIPLGAGVKLVVAETIVDADGNGVISTGVTNFKKSGGPVIVSSFDHTDGAWVNPTISGGVASYTSQTENDRICLVYLVKGDV